jgi:sugar phosphate isomerase/epimerase
MSQKHNIKRGVSLYSFQEKYYLRKMTLEDLITTMQKLDIPGVEIIGDQMIPNYPNISNEFFKQWYGWMDKYERTPVCLDMYLDWNKFKGRTMTDDEKFESVFKDIKNANKLGCNVIRVSRDVEPKLLERLVTEAEKYKATLALEIHAPDDFDNPEVQRMIELFERVQSPYLGFTLDMSLYCKRLPRVASDRLLREGMKKEIVDYLIEAYNSRTLPKTREFAVSKPELANKIIQMGATKEQAHLAYRATHTIYSNPQRILDYMPHIHHIHAKFYEMLPEYTEYSIPYDDIVPILIEGGYSGYIDSEYEGARWIEDAFEVDSIEQVRRQQVMLRRLLGETTS